ATGHQAFSGETTAVIFHKILAEDPAPVTRLDPDLPPELDRIITKCLEKDRDLRCQSAAEIRADLKRLKRDTGPGHSASVAPGFSPAQSLDADPSLRSGQALKVGATPSQHGSSDSQVVAALIKRHKKALFGIVAATLIAIAALAYVFRPTLPPPSVSGYVQLTNDGLPKRLVGTDGSRLYLIRQIAGSAFAIGQVSAAGGEVAPIPLPSPANMWLFSVSPNGSDLLLADLPGDSPDGPLWALPILGGPAKRLAELQGHNGAWSPDERNLVYANGNDLYIANGDGTGSRKLVSLDGPAWYDLAWSPNGGEIRFTLYDPKLHIASIWQVAVDGRNLHQILPGWHTSSGECCGQWTADGRYFVFDGLTELGPQPNQIWAMREAGSFLRKVSHPPVELTSGTVSYDYPLPGKDGKKLYAVAGLGRGELQRFDVRSHQFVPFLSGISACCTSFSRDHQWVTYVSYPEGNLWRAKADGSQPLQLTNSPMYAAFPRWSPDGKSIAFMGALPNKPFQIYIVAAATGTPKEAMESEHNQIAPTWSPDGTSLIFSSEPWESGTGAAAVYELNLKTQKETKLPGSDGLFAPRWSSDGLYVAATTIDMKRLMLFDFTTQKWSELTALAQQAWLEWSRDSQHVFFWGQTADGEPGIYRVGISNHKVDEIVSLKDFHQASAPLGGIGWVGLAPDDSPLLVKDTGTQDIVSMDWHEP
ncbi:MAG TPA: hypothetical protein VFQ24_13740, partial [Terriglobia bacterium]|nr:hypothetical protein [Terriglobia bacterium]